MSTPIVLNNSVKIPSIALGVYQASPEDTSQSVKWALEAGYRHIDTAAYYENEHEVGEAIRASGIPRSEIFVTSKLWNEDQGYEKALKGFNRSLQNLGLEYIDLYLLHSPVVGKRQDSWRALEELYRQGKIKSIGVSNYGVHHLEEMKKYAKVAPVVNQIEMHPFMQHRDIVDYCKANNIIIEAYCPLVQATRLDDATVNQVAKKHGKTAAQVLIRWGLEKGFVTLPKSVKKHRIHENFDVDFKLDKQDMQALDALEEGKGVSWDPTIWQ